MFHEYVLNEVRLGRIIESMPRRSLVLAATFAALAGAQEFRSTLTGEVTDPSGAIVANAKVTAIKSDTNSRFEIVSNGEGLYTIPFLPPGPYDLTAEAGGLRSTYKPASRSAATPVWARTSLWRWA